MTLNLIWPLTGSNMNFMITSLVFLSPETGTGIPLADRIGSGERSACETVLSKIEEYDHALEAPITELIGLIDATRSNLPLSAPDLKRKLELQAHLSQAISAEPRCKG